MKGEVQTAGDLRHGVQYELYNRRHRRAALGHLSPAELDNSVYKLVAKEFGLANAMRYIEEHYAEKLSLPEVAENVYVSQWHLSKLLNRYTGQSFYDILNIDHRITPDLWISS